MTVKNRILSEEREQVDKAAIDLYKVFSATGNKKKRLGNLLPKPRSYPKLFVF